MQILFKIIFWASILTVIYTHIGYPILLFIISIFKKQKYKIDNSYTPFLSVIISAYNEEKNLAQKLKNTITLSYPKDKIEFIIVSDGSTDNTNSIIREFEKIDTRIKKIILEKRHGKSYCLNRAIEIAEGEALLFTDANSILHKNAIYNLVRWLNNPKVGGVCGTLQLPLRTHENLYWKYEKKIKELENKIYSITGANGAIYIIKKELFEKLPETKNIPDDFWITLNILKKGYFFVYDKDAKAYEQYPSELLKEFERKKRIAVADFNTLQQILETISKRGFTLGFLLVSHKIFRWFSPLLLIIAYIATLFIERGSWLFSPYNITFLVLSIVYLLAFISWSIEKFLNKKIKIISIFGYFGISFWALLEGLFLSLFKKQKPYWEPQR